MKYLILLILLSSNAFSFSRRFIFQTTKPIVISTCSTATGSFSRVFTDSSGLHPSTTTPYAGGFVVYIFTGNGSLSTVGCSGSKSISYLIVGGGGGAANGVGYESGAGGAGGLLQGSTTISPSSFPIIVGSGGAVFSNGSDSKFNGLTAFGGGTCDVNGNGTNGGSGGGMGDGDGVSAGSPGLGTTGQGFDGGNASHSSGGGGAGGIGSRFSGGIGLANSITGNSIVYATGGSTTGSIPGSPNTGNGGSSNAVSDIGSPGGSGIVVVRLPY